MLFSMFKQDYCILIIYKRMIRVVLEAKLKHKLNNNNKYKMFNNKYKLHCNFIDCFSQLYIHINIQLIKNKISFIK